MRFKLHQPTLELLDELEGIEIGGAAHNTFGVNALNVAPMEEFEFYAQAQRDMGNDPLPIDIDAWADDIPVDDSSVDFVLSSHVIEHIPNLFSAFVEWNRIVRDGGYIVMIAPLPDALESDAGRPLTTYKDLKAAFDEERSLSDISKSHFWVFDCDRLKTIISKLGRKSGERPALKWELVGEEEKDSKVGNGFWLAYKVHKVSE